ncbi:MAG: sarcosine oxidase subunit gamma family protein [Roseiarcus sp.]
MTDVLASLPPSRRLAAGRYGAPGSSAGVLVREIARAAAVVVAGRGRSDAAARSASAAFGMEILDRPHRSASDALEFIGIGPGRWLALDAGDGDALVERLEAALSPIASVVDQSGGLEVFEATGAKIAHVLPKLVSIDVDPSVFPAGSAATTTAAGFINLTLWRVEADRWRFAVGRSFVCAFLRALASESAEYGLELGPEPPGAEPLADTATVIVEHAAAATDPPSF